MPGPSQVPEPGPQVLGSPSCTRRREVQLRDPERRSPNKDPRSHLSHCSLTPTCHWPRVLRLQRQCLSVVTMTLASTACFSGSFKQQKNQQVWKALRESAPRLGETRDVHHARSLSLARFLLWKPARPTNHGLHMNASWEARRLRLGCRR